MSPQNSSNVPITAYESRWANDEFFPDPFNMRRNYDLNRVNAVHHAGMSSRHKDSRPPKLNRTLKSKGQTSRMMNGAEQTIECTPFRPLARRRQYHVEETRSESVQRGLVGLRGETVPQRRKNVERMTELRDMSQMRELLHQKTAEKHITEIKRHNLNDSWTMKTMLKSELDEVSQPMQETSKEKLSLLQVGCS